MAEYAPCDNVRKIRVRSPLPFLINAAKRKQMENETLEKAVADAILERASDSITIEGHKFDIAPPTPATLILISELVSTMPTVNKNASNVLYEVLGTAKDLRVIGKIVATLILGAKRIRENRKIEAVETVKTRRWSWHKFRHVEKETAKARTSLSEVDWLADKLLYEVTPQTLLQVTAKRLGQMQLADFFALTTSLSVQNLTKRTKEVETARGE